MWYYELNGSQQGPESTAQIQQRLRNGELSGGTLLWREGMTDWTALSRIPELQGGLVPQPNPGGFVQGSIPQHPQGPPGVGMMPTQNGLALTSMILGICSVLLTFGCGIGVILAIPAVVLGHISRKQIRNSSNMQTGEGMAFAGLIIGYIMIGLTALMLIFIGFALVMEGRTTP